MATYTTNLNLKKPAYSDARDIGDINDNMDIIDSAVHTLSETVTTQGTAIDGKKPKQTAKTDPTASGTAVAFIDSLTQDANGVVTATKKTVRTVSKGNTGLCPALPNESTVTKFLRQDGNWAVPPGVSVTNTGNTLSWGSAIKIAQVGSTDITAKLPSNPAPSVSNTGNTLSWGSAIKIAQVGSTNITAKLPSNPNTWRGAQVKTYSKGFGLAGNGTITFSANDFNMSTPTGYFPAAIVRIAPGDSWITIDRFNAAATGTTEVLKLRGMKSSSTVEIGLTAYIAVLYLQS